MFPNTLCVVTDFSVRNKPKLKSEGKHLVSIISSIVGKAGSGQVCKVSEV